MARPIRPPRRKAVNRYWSYHETGTGLRQANYRTGRGYTLGRQPADQLSLEVRRGLRRTRNVAGVSELGRRVGRGVQARNNRMPRR